MAESTSGGPTKRHRGRLGCIGLVIAIVAFLFVVYGGGRHQGPGAVATTPVPPQSVALRAASAAAAAREAGAPVRQVLFGDLHVHSTFSADAFLRSLPLVGGEGAHPPADACDYARYCSQLDFFALTDHAEALTAEHYAESKQSIRDCNGVAPSGSPDLVAFMGFEWTQVGLTPETHYGHKNVIFREIDDAHLPPRAIAAPVPGDALRRPPIASRWEIPLLPLRDFANRDRYMDTARFVREITSMTDCPPGVPFASLPLDCREVAETPRQLFDKLDALGFESIVIPHGSTWGFYTPPGYVWDKQLDPRNDDPDRQQLVEVYSGHGNSEQYRSFRDIAYDASGSPVCPEDSPSYTPCCHRAGEIIRARCGQVSAAECDARVAQAELDYLHASVAGHQSIPDAAATEWGDCGQCRDCFLPSFNYRPGGSVQYMLTRGYFGGDEGRHAQFGFLASSDNHTARPGTGYKDIRRRMDTEATGAVSPEVHDRVFGARPPRSDRSIRLSMQDLMDRPPFSLVDLERQSSFFLTGGLVAVVADGRDRQSIWDALRARRVYGTSGDRILLWFDMVEDGRTTRGMGERLDYGLPPRFRVQAVGAQEQIPGCPDFARRALGEERLERLCGGECFQPSDRRKPITRVEVVRIRLQAHDGEDVAALISDPFVTLPCPPNEGSCTVEFTDPEYVAAARDTLYYVRAIEAPSDAVNGHGLRCDEEGRCEPCYGDYRVDPADDCRAPVEERAWSSPIWLDFVAVPQPAADAGVPE